MHRNDLFLLLLCAAALAAMAGNPPSLAGKHVTIASLWPRTDELPTTGNSELSTLQP